MMRIMPIVEIRQRLREHELFAEELPDYAALSWPMLKKNGSNVDYAFFIYPDPPVISIRDEWARPSHWLIASGKDGRILLFADCRITDFMPPGTKDSVPRRMIEESMTDLKKSIAETDRLFDAIAPWAFLQKDDIPPEIGLQVRTYLNNIENWQQGFMPFYRHLAPEFFEWAEAVSDN